MKISILLPFLAQAQDKWTCKDLLPDNGCAKVDSKLCNNSYWANYQEKFEISECNGNIFGLGNLVFSKLAKVS